MARKSKAVEKTAVEKLTEALAEFIIETVNENEPAEPEDDPDDEDENEDEDDAPTAKGRKGKGKKGKKDEPDFDDLKAQFTAFVKAEGKSSAKKLLKKFKIEQLADLDEDDYGDFQDALTEASGGEEDVE